MPVFEFVCKKCGKKSEFLIRGAEEKVVCECGSDRMVKLFSPFAVAENSGTERSGCPDGSCSIPSSTCGSGMCGI